MQTWIKICGLTNLEDALLAIRLGADAIGFVFHAASKRFCPPATARRIISELPPRTTPVGVWFDEQPEEIAETARFAKCSWVQTYEPMVASPLKTQGFDVVPAIPAGGSFIDDAWLALCACWEGPIIVDRSKSSRGAVESDSKKRNCPLDLSISLLDPRAKLVLAGGLHPENVFAELEIFRPSGVDVASGLEVSPSRKDPTKLKKFIEEVRRWDAVAGSMNLADSSFPRP